MTNQTAHSHTYEQLRVNQGRAAARPTEHERLLFCPISDAPMTEGAGSYADWEFDHGQSLRFYVGGMFWFNKITRMSMKDLSEYSERARTKLQETAWPEMPNSGNLWEQPIARTQYLAAKRRQALQFPKAGMIILTCEVALQDLIDRGETRVEQFESGAEVYRHMSIIPAVWNINDFTEAYWKTLDPEQISRICDEANQSSYALVRDLAVGATCTYPTASIIKATADQISTKTGAVRAQPGRRLLGTKRASELEFVNIG